jgi:hypothetical protein
MLSYQFRQQVEHILAIHVTIGADPLSRFQRPATREDRQPLQQRTLGFAEQVVAPVEGCHQRLLAREGGAAATGQETEPLVEPKRDLFGGQRVDPCRGKLQCQRNAVEALANLRAGSCIDGG